jgi:hypothetical protein
MNSRLALAAALLAGLASLAGASAPAASQAGAAVETPRVYDGAPQRPEAAAVFAGSGGDRRDPAQIAREEQERARGRANLAPLGRPIADAAKAPAPLATWNPLLSGAKGALAIGIVGFALGGPLGLLVGAAVGGMAAWGLQKISDA